MSKDFLTKIIFLFIRPKTYFEDVIGNKSFTLRDLFCIGIVLFPILTILHIFENDILNRYSSGFEIGVYLFAFVFGLILNLIFRTYFLSMVLIKSGTEVDYKKIGVIVAIAMISNVLMFLIPILIQTLDYNQYIEIVLRIWNLLLILIGLVVSYKIKWARGIMLLFIMFGFEMMLKFVIGGVRL